MNTAVLRNLYSHMEWADAQVWRAVLACDGARQDQQLRDLFYHLHLVQRAFLHAWRGEPRASYPKFTDLDSLLDWARSYYTEISPRLEAMADEELMRPMDLPWVEIVERELGRAPQQLSIGETIMQAPLHSLYHRGQINARLRVVGGEPPRVDYVIWAWSGRPAADWSWVKR